MSTNTLILLIKKYLTEKGKLFICLSGPSGAGKTYQAKKLSELLGLKHIDQDQFYVPSKMPKFTFSNGHKAKNWDCKEALDLDNMNATIKKYISDGIIFSGFACRDEWFTEKIDFQIHLSISEETCILRRNEQGKDGHMGVLIVKELVYPFYLETLKESNISFTIDTNVKSSQTMEMIIKFLINEMSQ